MLRTAALLVMAMQIVGCAEAFDVKRKSHAYVFSSPMVSVTPDAAFDGQTRPEARWPNAWAAPPADAPESADDETMVAILEAPEPEASPQARSEPARTGGLAEVHSVPTSTSHDEAHAVEYVRAVFGLNGIDLGKASTLLGLYKDTYRAGQLYHAPRPMVGDLVYFHNTFDRNNDGRWNDWYTLVGFVEGVEGDGTVKVLVYLGGRVQRLFMNLAQPGVLADASGKTLNSLMRDGEEPGGAPAHLGSAARLFAGFANVLGDVQKFVVVDNWQPGMALNK